MNDSPSTDRSRELRAVIRLATPIILVQMGMMLMGTIDTMMLGRVSETALASGALGNTVSFGLLVFSMGLLMALDPLISQAWGAGDETEMARQLQRGMVLALALSVPLGLAMWDTRWLLSLLGQDATLIEPTAQYIRAVVPGIPAFLLFTALRQTLQAMSLVRQALIAIIVANVVNVVANYGLIFGHLGMPQLGVVGSGFATSLSRWTMFLGLLLAAWPIVRPYFAGLRRSIWQLKSYGTLLRLGIPIGFHISVEMLLFSAVALLMGYLGARELAAHQIALSLSAMAYMVPLGISGAAVTRVGNAIGRGDAEHARLSAKVSLWLGAGVMTISAMGFALFPRLLSRLFTPEMAVIELAAVLLPVAALFQVFDGLQVVCSGVLRGAADTRTPAIIALLGYWGFGLPFGWALCFHFGLGPRGLWLGLTLGLALVAVALMLRLRSTARSFAALSSAEAAR